MLLLAGCGFEVDRHSRVGQGSVVLFEYGEKVKRVFPQEGILFKGTVIVQTKQQFGIRRDQKGQGLRPLGLVGALDGARLFGRFSVHDDLDVRVGFDEGAADRRRVAGRGQAGAVQGQGQLGK